MIKHINLILLSIFISLFIVIPTPLTASETTLENLKATSRAFNTVAKTGMAAVVSISTKKYSTSTASGSSPYFSDYFSSLPQGSSQQEGLGSGVLVSSDGFILTNYHVVEGTRGLTIMLSDGREFDAKIVGSDKKTDLALLKISGKNLPVIKWANSDKVLVGDWSIAVGNPFGLSGTVTVGVISAVGRSTIEGDNYSDFLQTDAAINPGNSGGALLDIDGRLMGINAAIYTQSGGGYMGVGFAIPSNMARRIMKDLKLNGRVVRGSLGIVVDPLTPSLKKALGLRSKRGAYVKATLPGSPSALAGLQAGDVIVAFDHKPVHNFKSLRSKIGERALGETVNLSFIRDQTKHTIDLILEKKKMPTSSLNGNDPFGLSLIEVNDAIITRYGLHAQAGLLVSDVVRQSPAHMRFVTPGDVIIKINDHDVTLVSEYQAIIEDETSVSLKIQRGRYLRQVTLYKQKEGE